MTPNAIASLQRYLPTIGTIVTIAIAWALLTAQVDRLKETKAERTEVTPLARDVEEIKQDVRYLICRQYPNDSKCARTP